MQTRCFRMHKIVNLRHLEWFCDEIYLQHILEVEAMTFLTIKRIITKTTTDCLLCNQIFSSFLCYNEITSLSFKILGALFSVQDLMYITFCKIPLFFRFNFRVDFAHHSTRTFYWPCKTNRNHKSPKPLIIRNLCVCDCCYFII